MVAFDLSLLTSRERVIRLALTLESLDLENEIDCLSFLEFGPCDRLYRFSCFS